MPWVPGLVADRLAMLTEEGVPERVQYAESPARNEYHLTEKGEDLYPLLLALIAWGDRWKSPTPPVAVNHRACGHTIALEMRCPHCDRPVERRDVREEFASDAW